MNPYAPSVSHTRILEKARSSGASLAGITSIEWLRRSPSYQTYGKFELPGVGNSVLVLATLHGEDEPELDWWDNKRGGSPGNRQLENVAKTLGQWLHLEFNINARLLPYHAEKGGILLKDAATLAGLGAVGLNNLLITPEFGPRVRFRAMLIDEALEPTGPIDFSPCEACDMVCRRVCPQKAFKTGSYSKTSCYEQMKDDESPGMRIKYCRACELACNVGAHPHPA